MKCGRGAGGFAASGTTRFPDVADTAYYLDAASWAADSGLMNGYSDGRSGVNDSITRQQVTAIFWRWAGSPETSAEDYAGEDAISGYAKTAVDWARANGIVPQREENRFAPAESATRGEIAQILYNHYHQSGKTVIPFCTSASSGLGQSGRLLAEMANSGDWQEGQRFSSGVPAATVSAWAGGTEPPRRRGPERTAGGLRSGNGGGIFAGDSALARKKTRGRLSQAVPFSPAGQFRPGLPGRGRSCPGHFPRPPPEPGGTAGRSRPRPEVRR